MDLLNLDLMGWLVSVVSGIALALGMLIVGSHCAQVGFRAYAARRVLEDGVLFLIWLLGLAGGIGLLQGRAWSRPALELFCWTLMVLLVMSSWSHLRSTPPPRNMRALQLALFVMPVVVFCIAAIVTLRGENALRALSG
jgi:hypothetical protein